jgi:hypothetical protein
VEDVPELNGPEAVQMWTVRVAFHFGEGVVLAVHGDPFLRADTGGDPEAHPEHERDGRMKFERLVSGAAVEKDRRTEDGGLRDEGRCKQAPDQLPEHATAYHIIRCAVRTPS